MSTEPVAQPGDHVEVTIRGILLEDGPESRTRLKLSDPGYVAQFTPSEILNIRKVADPLTMKAREICILFNPQCQSEINAGKWDESPKLLQVRALL